MKGKWMAALTGVCAASLALGLVACGQANGAAQYEEEQQTVVTDGTVLAVPSGFPTDSFGEDGDVCFAMESGDFYRKDKGAWYSAGIDRYDIADQVLSVTFADGGEGRYRMISSESEKSECKHEGLEEAEVYKIYDPYCVVPGIGVKYCSHCGMGFPVMIAVDPEQHSIDESNFSRCRFCSKLEDGSDGFVVDSSNVGRISEAVEQLQDGDTLYLGNPNVESSPETSPEVLAFTDTTPLDIGANKDITVEVRDNVDVSFTSGDSSSALTVGAGSTLNFTGGENGEGESGDNIPTVYLDSKTTKPAVSVSGKDAVVNVEGVEINCHNTTKVNGSKGNPSISVSKGGTLNLGEGTFVNEKDADSTIHFYDAYGIKATGNKSVVKIDGATINSEGRGSAVLATDGATIEFVSGEVNVTANDGTVGLCVGNNATLEMSGGVINVTGDLTGGTESSRSQNCAAAIGENNWFEGGSTINVTGGIINLTPTAGRAYAITTQKGSWTTAYLSGSLVIHVNAAEGAQAAAFAIAQAAPCEILDYVVVDGWTAETNVDANPDDRNFFQWRDEQYTGLYGALTDSRTKA